MSSAEPVAGLDIILAGQAGQGVSLAAQLLGRALVRQGLQVHATMDTMSRIRGGDNSAWVRVSGREVACRGDRAQLLVCLDPALVGPHRHELAPDAVVLTGEGEQLESDGSYRLVQVPLKALAVKHGGRAVMANAVALGCVIGLFEAGTEALGTVLGDRFDDVAAEANRKCVEAGYALMRSRARLGTLGRLPEPQDTGTRLFLSGAQAMALGAFAAGVRVVAGYPMSPGTPILEACAGWAGRAQLVVEQTEDEIAALNLCLGASFAGARALVATAGGGFALMNEAFSLAGMTETGVVVCLGMRPGPATGLATRTAQADLLFAVHAGHGEFPRAVLAPGDASQAFDAVRRACGLAERFQTPVIVLFDQFLADGLWTMAEPDAGPAAVPGRDEPAGAPEEYARYRVTGSGISPRVLPGDAGRLVYADSDEHTEQGHITESAETRVRMVDKRNRKLAGIAAELEPPEVYPPGGAETTVCCFGSTRGVVREAVDRLREEGRDVAMVHFRDVWPFPAETVRGLLDRSRRVLTVENNSTGQLAMLLAQEARIRADGTVARFDGRAFEPGEVARGIEEQAGG